ncbi:thiosulfate oxidation carrier complex protein SoxZ [uncultured Thiohalocapsa sp.]|uniref:thiosulfate oxidation carrier complex protein SoxZ n=1 Tax=uncultured Thiohalocapsa sp. TaxID=768990 RepID=UPI0025ECCFB6|nr:thiosulfate oxidation carrier complex protein SoxZ [uncultured Thiohalocapsa sp.]
MQRRRADSAPLHPGPVCEHNGAPVLGMDWGWGVSANPYVAFQIASGAAGDRVTLRWHDNRGDTGELSTTVV